MASDITILEDTINYKFKNNSYLINALTHSSYNPHHYKERVNNERMEFLGDKILGFIIAEEIYNKFPDKPEGYLSKCLSYLTSSKVISKVGKSLNIEQYIKKNNELKDSIIVNTCEAIIAAIYLDSNDIIHCKNFILKFWDNYIESYNIQETYLNFNPKSFVQEWAQNLKLPIPEYNCVKKEGTEHNPIFYVEIVIKGYKSEIAAGSNKKTAEKNAAAKFININIIKK